MREPMGRRPRIPTIVFMLVLSLGIGGAAYAISRAVTLSRALDSRSGPVHRFPLPAGRATLVNEEASRLAREVMHRDGYPAPAWRMVDDDRRTSAHARNGLFAFAFWCEDSPTPNRYVRIEVRGGEVVGQGTLGK